MTTRKLSVMRFKPAPVGVKHGPQSWPWWRLVSFKFHCIGCIQHAPLRTYRIWIYSRWAAYCVDLFVDRRAKFGMVCGECRKPMTYDSNAWRCFKCGGLRIPGDQAPPAMPRSGNLMSGIVTGGNLPEDLKMVLAKYGVPMERAISFVVSCHGVNEPLLISWVGYAVHPDSGLSLDKIEKRIFKLLAVE